MSAAIDVLDTLAITQSRLTSALPTPVRPWNGMTGLSGRANLIYGPRGVGKTSLLLRQAMRTKGRYLSMDHPALYTATLYEWVNLLFERGIQAVYLDEIHAARNWSQDLKALYDAWPGKTIWASGSNSLLLSSGVGDLSRRFLGIRMPLLSFREFLVLRGFEDFGLQTDFEPDPLWVRRVHDACPVLSLFEEYLKTGFRPFFVEGVEDYPDKCLQTVQKTILADIPALLPAISQNHFRLMNAVLGYLAQSPIPVLQVNSLCREWNLGKEKLYGLLHAMEQTGILRLLRHPTDHTAMSVGAKIFLADPSLYQVLGGKEGNTREAFVACALESAGHRVNAAKDETAADFIIDGRITLEVGGQRKARKRADLVIRDGADFPAPGIVPLWILGFLW